MRGRHRRAMEVIKSVGIPFCIVIEEIFSISSDPTTLSLSISSEKVFSIQIIHQSNSGQYSLHSLLGLCDTSSIPSSQLSSPLSAACASAVPPPRDAASRWRR